MHFCGRPYPLSLTPHGYPRAQVRKWMPGWQFEVFNPVFICTYQPLLLLALAAPAAMAAQHVDVPLGPLDLVAAGLFVMLLAGETVADIQMFNYQTEKYRRKNAGMHDLISVPKPHAL